MARRRDFRFDLDWRGPQVRRRVLVATKDGIDTVMGDCVKGAKRDVPRATASYQGSIRIVEPARVVGNDVAGYWGSTDINYALAIETGDFGYLRDADLLGDEPDHRVPTRANKGNRGSLRKMADRYYPGLPAEIRRRVA